MIQEKEIVNCQSALNRKSEIVFAGYVAHYEFRRTRYLKVAKVSKKFMKCYNHCKAIMC